MDSFINGEIQSGKGKFCYRFYRTLYFFKYKELVSFLCVCARFFPLYVRYNHMPNALVTQQMSDYLREGKNQEDLIGSEMDLHTKRKVVKQLSN